MATQFFIDTNGFKCAGVSAGPRYAYDDNGNRTNNQDGTFVEVAVVNHGFEKFRVNLPGMTPLLDDGEEFPEGTMVEFQNLRIRPYANRQGRLAFTASADDARIVGPKPQRPGVPEGK